MDSNRANAAQLAARSIKAKPRGRLNNQKGGFVPVQSNNDNNNNAAAAGSGGGGGGLFGGSISAPGSFNFAAPAGTPSFSTSFGDSTPNPFAQPAAASTPEDPRADTTGEEALRRGKGFRAAGVDEEALFAAHSPFHHNQPSNTFGSSNNTQPQTLFGAANATQSNGGGLQFDSSTSQNQTGNSSFGGFNFTPTLQATNNNSNSTFAFGSSSQAPANNNSTSAFTFGGTNSSQAENSLNFGANAPSQAQNLLTIENQKASYFNSDPSYALDNYNFSFPTTLSTNQFDNSTFGQHHYYPNDETETMLGNYKVEYPANAGQAPAQTPQLQNPMRFSDNEYRGTLSAGFPTGSSFAGNSPLASIRANIITQENNSGTSFGQSNTNNSFGAQNNSYGGSFGGSFENQANMSFSGLNSTNLGPSNSQSMFGGITADTSGPSTANLFGNAASSFPTTSASNNLNGYGNVNSSFPPAAASNTPLFGAVKPADTTAPASNTPLFGAIRPADSTTPASSTPLFGAVKPASSTPLFGGFKPADPTPSASSTQVFGGVKLADSSSAVSGNPLFGGFKHTDSNPSSSGTSSVFAKPLAAPASAVTFTNLGNSAGSTSNLFNPNNQNHGQSNNIFGPRPVEEPKDKQTLDLFSPNRPVGQPISESNATENTTEKTPAKTPNALFDSFGKANSPGQFQLHGAAKEPSVSCIPDSIISDRNHANLQKLAAPSDKQAGSSFKIRGNAEASGFDRVPSSKSADIPADAAQSLSSNTLGSFSSQTQDTQALSGPLSNGSSSDSMALSAPTNSSSQSLAPVDQPLAPGRLSDFEFQVSEPTVMEIDANMPRHFDTIKRNQFHALWRITSLQKSMAAYFHHLPPGADPSKGLAWMQIKKKEILAGHKIDYISNKRGRAEIDLDYDEDQENMSPQKRTKPVKERPRRVPSPEKRSRNTQSPEKRSRAINEPESQLNGNSVVKAPKLQPGRSSSPSKSSSRSAAPEATSSKKRKNELQLESGDGKSGGNKKRKNETQIESGDGESDRNKKRKPEQSSHNEEAESGGSKKRKPELYLTQNDPEGVEDGKNSNKRTVNGSSSSTSNMFKNILDSPENSSRSASPERKTRALPGSVKEAVSVPAKAPLANPFGTLPGASPIKSNTATTSTTPTKPPVFKFTPTSTTPTISPTKPSTFTGAPSGGIKPPNFTGAPTGGVIKPPTFAGAPTGGVKPPTFGSGPVNFMAQFGQQAAKSAEDNEKELMQKAKDEDFDSEDDDEAEWEANYRKKRAADLKKLAELAKGKAPTFLVKSTESAKTTESKETAKPAATNIFAPVATTTATPLFGQAKPATGAAESIFSSGNASRTSTPNLFSGTGSVLDGAATASGKIPSFAGNPFAHLSDADSNTQNDGDDESSDDGSDGEDEEQDPSYKSNAINGTPSTSSTPVDETSPGITSIKQIVAEPPKLNLFGSAASSSTTTPTPSTGGSLLSRMTRDPVPEEKENSVPKSTMNLFGSSFGATPGTLTDKTWKPDTPIKFGSAAPSAPTFNITGSTPTKPVANPFGGLFGNSATTTPALSAGPTTTTGFQFGGPASTTSSLFPSVAASAGTSRATSPGVTTDGATDADDDNPEKVHAQVNLLESNPGEENEDVVHSIRARALKFCPNQEGDGKTSPWDTKGVGPLKVLRHKETKATRIVLRSDPSGSIILNKSLLSQVKYEASGKTIKLMTVGDDGIDLQTWVLQLKGIELAEELAKCLEDNKVNNN
ncbi:hypothetical protein SBOR_7344 [Sclerotinia borealis F-4128]|uniref:RanBD1 domain-containing protein n=1 Tax=Sclerotinia borealis (strain F-4128) TaxID=1432307 RepID=W9CBQ3_SCLBF|nr:hypothetical protein SBOR_7344 [Sclerotinia borealis F-4128]